MVYPKAIKSDNGSPFATRSLASLSRLSVWWIKLGIIPERIKTGAPIFNVLMPCYLINKFHFSIDLGQSTVYPFIN
jgi:hypothetical protein